MHLDVENMQDQNSNQSEVSNAVKPLKEIGRLIRGAREEKALSIEDLAGSLRIGQEQLVALENGEEGLLPEKVFIKAMIRRVSERLQLDLSALINDFQSVDQTIPGIPSKEVKPNPYLKIFIQIPTWILLTGLIGIVTSGFAITLLGNNSKESLPKRDRPKKVLAPKIKALDSSYHIVAPGQTLTTISKFHEIPLKTLIRINDLTNPDQLKIGTKISLKEKSRRISAKFSTEEKSIEFN